MNFVPQVYYDAHGSPYAATAIPLPVSPYHTPYGSPRISPRSSPYAVQMVPLPPSPAAFGATLPVLHLNPFPTPPVASPVTTTTIAEGTLFTPHSVLEFDPQNPRMLWDVRLPPHTIRIARHGHRDISRYADEQALSPPWTFVRLRSSLIPWVMECSNPSGVKVNDIITTIYESLRARIDNDEFREESRDFQNRLLDTWKRRCHMVGERDGRAAGIKEEDKGVRRVDWLLWDHEWLGISRDNEALETWEVHFRSR